MTTIAKNKRNSNKNSNKNSQKNSNDKITKNHKDLKCDFCKKKGHKTQKC